VKEGKRMPEEFEMAEDVDEESDDSEEESAEGEPDEDSDDSEATFRGRYSSPRFVVASTPAALGMPGYPVRDDPAPRGVSGGLIRSDQGTAVFRFPTPVAPMRFLRRESRRRRGLATVVADHDRRIRAMGQWGNQQGKYVTAAVSTQHLRDVANDLQQSVGPAFPGLSQAFAAADYSISSAQTALAVAAIPPARRSWLFWSLPAVAGLGVSTVREFIRLQPGGGIGFGAASGKAGWPLFFTLAAPTVTGVVASILVKPQRVRRTVRYVRI
jgi:hypothetical protein